MASQTSELRTTQEANQLGSRIQGLKVGGTFHQHPSGFINQGHDQQAFMKSNNHLLSKTRQRFGSRFFSTTKRLNGVLLLQLSYIGGI